MLKKQVAHRCYNNMLTRCSSCGKTQAGCSGCAEQADGWLCRDIREVEGGFDGLHTLCVACRHSVEGAIAC